MSFDPALVPRVRLGNGVEMPQLGIGTSHGGGYSEEALCHALQLGVGLIDTAQRYGTEEKVSQCISLTDRDRTELFLTTKLWPDRYARVSEATATSLSNLKTDYLCRRRPPWFLT